MEVEYGCRGILVENGVEVLWEGAGLSFERVLGGILECMAVLFGFGWLDLLAGFVDVDFFSVEFCGGDAGVEGGDGVINEWCDSIAFGINEAGTCVS